MDRMSVFTVDNSHQFQSVVNQRKMTLALRSSIVNRKPSKQLQQAFGPTILQRRDQIRIYEDNEDVTPRGLYHPEYHCLDEKITAFDAINQLISQSAVLLTSTSLGVQTSSTSVYTQDDFMLPKLSSRSSLGGSLRAASERILEETASVDSDIAPSQFPLPKLDSREFTSTEERIVLTLKETETKFLFELPQQTEDANTEEGRAVAEENERYRGITGGLGRKIVSAEVQTPQRYTKTRSTFVGRKDRKNSSTYVNNWIMHDSYLLESDQDAAQAVLDRFKFSQTNSEKDKNDTSEVDEQLEALGKYEGFENAVRVTLRILAGKNFEIPQKQFAGMLRQDPSDPELKLDYNLNLLWKHENPEHLQKRPVSAFQWNPVNDSLLAVGYGTDPKLSKSPLMNTPEGRLLIWCAKNPTEPDRSYEFSSAISGLDWSKTKPNLLAIGFYDGVIRVIDVSKRKLVVLRETQRKDTNSFGPYWQVQWWPLDHEPLHERDFREQLVAGNQDGKVSIFSSTADFVPRELIRVKRIVGVKRVNHCLGHDVPMSRFAAVHLIRRHPDQMSVYLLGTDEGCVLRCSIGQKDSYLENFLAHDGPIYSLEFSPFYSGLLLTCGADWYTRVWSYDLMDEPLLSFNSGMACVNAAAWSPRNSTIFATAVENEIFIWDLSRKGYRPTSVTQVSSQPVQVISLGFTRSGEQLVAGDDDGTVYIFGLTGMPLPAFDQKQTLIDAVSKALLTKPELLHRLKKLDPLFVL